MAEQNWRRPREQGGGLDPTVPAAAAPRPPPGVLAVTLGVLHAIAEGTPTEVALCRCLALETEAVVVAHVEMDAAAGTVTVVSWPSQADAARALPFLDTLPTVVPHLIGLWSTDHRARRLSAEPPSPGWRDTVAAMLLEDLLGCRDVAQVPLDGDGPGLSLLVLGSRSPFGATTVHLLDCLRGPLSDLLRIAAPHARDDGPAGDDRPPGLTQREVEVLRLMAEGLMARTIALRLRISTRTVHKHLGNIYRKLDAHDRLVAVRRAERLGLLDGGGRPPLPVADGLLTLRW